MSKTVLITGANRGIGFAIAQRFLESDSSIHVILGSRSRQNGEDAVAQLKKDGYSTVSSIELDITSDDSIAKAVRTVEERHKKLDVLVNNAAIAYAPGSLRESLGTILSMNVISTGEVMEAFLPLLQKSSDPRIINLSSTLGSLTEHTVPGLFAPDLAPHYCISKSALNMLGVQFEKSHPEIIVQSVNPGYCKTGMNDYQGGRDPKEGANVVIILALSERGKYPGKGYWETIENSMEPTRVPW